MKIFILYLISVVEYQCTNELFNKQNILGICVIAGVIGSIIVYKTLKKSAPIPAQKVLPHIEQVVDNSNLTNYLNKHKYVLLPCVLILMISVTYLVLFNSSSVENSINAVTSDIKKVEEILQLSPELQESHKKDISNPITTPIDEHKKIHQDGFLNILNGVYLNRNTSADNIFYGLVTMIIVHTLMNCILFIKEKIAVKIEDDYEDLADILRSTYADIIIVVCVYILLYGGLYCSSLSLPSSFFLNIIYFTLISLLSNEKIHQKLETFKKITISPNCINPQCSHECDDEENHIIKYTLNKNDEVCNCWHNNQDEILQCTKKCQEKFTQNSYDNIAKICETHKKIICQRPFEVHVILDHY